MRSRLRSTVVSLLSLVLILSSIGVVIAGGTRTWQMAGGTPDRQRRSVARIEPPLAEAWDTGGEGSIWGVRPILSTKYAYLGFTKLVDEETQEYERRIEKRKLEDGEIIWEYDKAWNLWGSYKGDLIIQGFDDNFKAWIRRIDGGDRHTVWDIPWIRTTRKTAIENDVIYSLSFSDTEYEEVKKRFHFLQAHSAEKGRLLWRNKYQYEDCANTGFCIWEDSIYATVGQKFMKLSKSSGGTIWSIELPEKLPNNMFITADENGVFYTTIHDELIMISHEDGSKVWSQQLSSYEKEEHDDTPSSSAGIMNGKVYIQSRGNHHEGENKSMYCFESKSGQLVWETVLPGTSILPNFDIGHNVTCTKSAVYCISEAPGKKDSQLTAFDPEDGRIIWADSVPGVPYMDEIAVTTGYVVMGFADTSDADFPIYDYKCWTNIGVDKPKLEVEDEEFTFGAISGKDKIRKKFKIWSGTSAEIVGTIETKSDWLTVSPSSFSGKEAVITLTANPKFLKIGANKTTFQIKSNGGDIEITITAIYSGEEDIIEKIFNYDVTCIQSLDWKKIIKLEGFHQGKVTTSSPWLIVEPSIIMGTDIEVVLKINPTLLTVDNKIATAKIETNIVLYDIKVNVDSVMITRNIEMWINKTNALVSGETTTVDPPPQILQSRTMLPLRFTGEALGVEFVWKSETRIVEYKTFSGELVVLGIGNKVAYIGEKIVTIDPPPQIIDGRTMVPVRFVSESLGADVDWDGVERKVTVNLEICQ